MAKKHTRSGKPTPGGRVTPKGVRPDGPAGVAGHDSRPGAVPPVDHAPGVAQRHDPGRRIVGQPGPTRAGHHRGQR